MKTINMASKKVEFQFFLFFSNDLIAKYHLSILKKNRMKSVAECEKF